MLIMQITKRLGSSTPLIVSTASGLIGREALTNEFREVSIFFFFFFFFFLGWGAAFY